MRFIKAVAPVDYTMWWGLYRECAAVFIHQNNEILVSRLVAISLRSDGGERRLEIVHGYQPHWSSTRNYPGYEVENKGHSWRHKILSLIYSVKWIYPPVGEEGGLSTSPPSLDSSVPSNPKVLVKCFSSIYIKQNAFLLGYPYNVSKSAVVTLTRCIGNEVVAKVESDNLTYFIIC